MFVRLIRFLDVCIIEYISKCDKAQIEFMFLIVFIIMFISTFMRAILKSPDQVIIFPIISRKVFHSPADSATLFLSGERLPNGPGG